MSAPETWTLPLVTLRDTLMEESVRARGKWAMRMAHGVLVAMMQEDTGKPDPDRLRFVLRVARPVRPETDVERDQWANMLAMFERMMQLKDPPWERVEETAAAGVAVRYVERTDNGRSER